MADKQAGYLPALRFRVLTPLFDPVVRIATRETKFKERLLDQAQIASGETVLDLGCGTGTLAISLKQRDARAAVTGLDADPEVLSRARRKAAEADVQLDFVEGLSTRLPFPDDHFDVVLSTLFFHHLTLEDKQRSLREVRRVLAPRGRLHVVDYGKPGGPLTAGLFYVIQLFDGFETTRDHRSGRLEQLFTDAGFHSVARCGAMPTPFGTLAFYRARAV